MSTQWNDMIVALATPQGVGAIGVIRLSGNGCIELMSQLFPSKDLTQQLPNTIHVGLMKDGDQHIDEVVVSIFKAPKSYTGEDVIEISCHGSSYIIQQIIETCIRNGARLAKPGEFTLRAFLNGKMDLVQAEAVADLIASGTKAAQETALNQVRGGFSHVLTNLREELISFSALIELELDFSQEDVEFADRTRLRNLLDQMEKTVNELLYSFQLGNVIKNGVSVAIIGKPNAGKSTLLNTLLKENRAIVSSIAGTTRDTIEEVLNIDGILFRLIDTAGIREGLSDSDADKIEAIGIERSKQKIQQAQLVLLLADATTDSISEVAQWAETLQAEFPEKKIVLIINKSDVSKQIAPAFVPHLYLSALTGEGVESLTAWMVDQITNGVDLQQDIIVSNARHVDELQKTAEALEKANYGLEIGITGDFVAMDIRQA
ncbi:MAG: tRNA uridine-5-carboxymethylaminomethyl(34) synthesis GTPase MnmE, partial [Chitinophagia bacterium]|nr:tRNA uridine-5-carboxymethylaminomethyl(34) synthesis GTPase MnmE [Chitinophagia bacterium]